MAETFVYDSDDFVTSFESPVEGEDSDLSKFDEVVRKQWDGAMEHGYFTYKLDKVLTRIVPGKLNIVLQLNPKRGTLKRRAEFVHSLTMPFDPNKFNFNKIRPEEVLVNLVYKGKETSTDISNPVIINMSPLEYGHVLLVPEPKTCRPQALTPDAVRLGLHFLLLTKHRGVYVAFNGLCAMASVNHLHLHAWYLEHPTFPQTSAVKQVCGDLHMTLDLPVPAYIFELRDGDVERLVKCVYSVCSHLQQSGIAHNMMLLRGTAFETSHTWTVRALIWPRKSVIGEKNAEFLPFNLAVAELCCHIPYYDSEAFEHVTEDALVSRLREECLPSEQMEELTHTLCSLYKDLFTGLTPSQTPVTSLSNGL